MKNKKYILISVLLVLIIPSVSFGFLIGSFLRGYKILGADNVISIVTTIFSGFMGFIGSLLGVLGAFYIYRLQIKNENEKKKDEEYKQKEHKKMILYTLLEFTYLQTRISYKDIISLYKNTYKDAYKDLVIKYNLSGDFKYDYYSMLKVKQSEDTQKFDEYIDKLSEKLRNNMIGMNISDKVIYIENWYDYLDCIDDLKDLNLVRIWITMLKNSDKRISSYHFIANRDEINKLIKKNYPRVIDEGVRAEFKKVNIEL